MVIFFAGQACLTNPPKGVHKMRIKKSTAISKAITIETAVKTFLSIETLGLARETRAWYEKRLMAFAGWVEKTKPIKKISESDLLKYYAELETRVSSDTTHGHIRILKKFFRFLHDREMIKTNIAKNLKMPRLAKRARKGISDKNVMLILNAAKSNTRDYAVLNFLESTSARRGGVANLKLSDLNLDKPEPYCRRVTIFEKGKKDRTVIMSRECLNALKKYIKSRDSNSEYVFIAQDGKPLTVWGITEILERYKRRLKINEPVSPHQWRHRWCRKRIQEQMPLKQVSQLAGHASIQVTADFYGTFAIDELAEAYDKYYKPPV